MLRLIMFCLFFSGACVFAAEQLATKSADVNQASAADKKIVATDDATSTIVAKGAAPKAKSAVETKSSYTSQRSPAAQGSDLNYSVLFNPIMLLVNSAVIEFEFRVADKISLLPTFGYSSYSQDEPHGKLTTVAYSAGLSGRYYFVQALRSWFADAGAEFVMAQAKYAGITGSATGYGAHALAGYRWQWTTFCTELGVGMQYISIKAKVVDVEYKKDGVYPALAFNIGLAF